MNTLELSKKTVKIFSQRIEFDWVHPYKNKETSQGIGSGFFIDNKGPKDPVELFGFNYSTFIFILWFISYFELRFTII